ncbi:MAG: RAMP superfamily CRISPR-associated protein, partial [Desulfococcaceae bacterium]
MTGQWTPQSLRIKLLSDATFSRGEGTAGFVDTDIEHDGFGIPFVGGKTIRGLLRDSWLSMSEHFPEREIRDAAERVLGRTASMDEECRLRIGDALFPDSVRRTIEAAKDRVPPETILAAFTAIRAQTAENRVTGAPEKTTLRTSRVLLRGFEL